MQHPPAKTKKILYIIAVLALTIAAVNSLGALQAAAAKETDSSQSSSNPAASISNSKQPQMRPSPAIQVDSYVFKPQPNGTITAFNASSGAVIYTATDLSLLLNQMPSYANISLKSGNYTMRSQYIPKDGQRIIGESGDNVEIVGYRTRTDYALIGGCVSNLELANFTFNVNNPNPSSKQTPNCGLGIFLLGSNNSIHDLTLYSAYLQGIVMGFYGSNIQSDGNLVENCEIYGCGNDGIVLSSCTNSQIKNCYIHDSYGPVAGGVNVAYSSRSCIVKDCASNNTAYGFATDNSLGSPEESITFQHNSCNASYINGFMVDGGSNVVFEDDTASGYEQYGFVSFANPFTGASPSYVSYSGNTATEASNSCGVGFCLTQGSDFTFTGNQAAGNLVGLEVQSMTGKAQIEGCTFGGNTAHDVMVVNNPAYTSIANCWMDSSAPVWVDGDSGSNTAIQNCVYS
jgi:parallel beta-helix repeat (two copies)